jgi:hypothetical protein
MCTYNSHSSACPKVSLSLLESLSPPSLLAGRARRRGLRGGNYAPLLLEPLTCRQGPIVSFRPPASSHSPEGELCTPKSHLLLLPRTQPVQLDAVQAARAQTTTKQLHVKSFAFFRCVPVRLWLPRGPLPHIVGKGVCLVLLSPAAREA